LVNVALVIVAVVTFAVPIVAVVNPAMSAFKFVELAVVVNSAVPVALVKVKPASDDVAFTIRYPAVEIFAAERPPAKVEVPEPAATVIAPPNVEVAVDVAIIFPIIARPWSVVEASAAEDVAVNVPYAPFDAVKFTV
jgi:hypothetical protein